MNKSTTSHYMSGSQLSGVPGPTILPHCEVHVSPLSIMSSKYIFEMTMLNFMSNIFL